MKDMRMIRIVLSKLQGPQKHHERLAQLILKKPQELLKK
jgi:hypothetical protein